MRLRRRTQLCVAPVVVTSWGNKIEQLIAELSK